MKALLMVPAIAAALTAPTMGADLPFKAPAMQPTVVSYQWTGLYLGGHAGYGWGRADTSMALTGQWLDGNPQNTADSLRLTPLGNRRIDDSTFTGGLQVGYNWQSGHAVLGIEGDVSYFRLRDDFEATLPLILVPAQSNPYLFNATFKTNYLATIRGRAGYAADRWLLFATGGLAIAGIEFSQTITQLNVPFVQPISVSRSRFGWTVGAGAEYAATGNWSIKAEYLYADFGTVSASSSAAPVSPTYTGVHGVDLAVHTVRAGINYRFGGPTVADRY
jgi:outer membrane immunogenic protein